MSTIVETNNSLVFGPQSPIYRIVNDSGVKENFIKRIVDKSSVIYRKRAWNVYKLANDILPGKTIEINENVKSGIGKLLDSFITNDFQTIDKLVMATPRQKYNQGEIALTSELTKATGIKNTIAFVCDTEKEVSTNCHAPVVYLTRTVTSGECKEIIPSWSNKFFTFNEPQNLIFMVAIPKQYIASILQLTLSSVSKEVNHGTALKDIDRLVIRGTVIDLFVADLIKAIFQAIYSDGLRARVTSDILLCNALLQKEGFNSTSGAINENGENKDPKEIYTKYIDALKQFKRESNVERLIADMLEVFEYNPKAVTINPIDFYQTFIDTPNSQFIDLLERIPQTKRLELFTNAKYAYNFIYSNNLKEMNIFNQEKERNTLLYAIKLIRFIPVLYFTTFVLGGGSYQNECRIVVNHAKSIIGAVMSFKSGNAWSGPIVEALANNLNFILNDLYNQFASPLAVNSASVSILSNAIQKYSRVVEEIAGKDDNGYRVEEDTVNGEPGSIAE